MRRETLRDPGQMLVQPWWQRYCLARSSLTDLILKGALLRASRRMAACSDVPVAILRDGRPSKSAVADFDTLDCRSRASPTSVGGLLRMRVVNVSRPPRSPLLKMSSITNDAPSPARRYPARRTRLVRKPRQGPGGDRGRPRNGGRPAGPPGIRADRGRCGAPGPTGVFVGVAGRRQALRRTPVVLRPRPGPRLSRCWRLPRRVFAGC